MLQIDRSLTLTITDSKAGDRLAAALRLAVGRKLTDGAAAELVAAQVALSRLRIYAGVPSSYGRVTLGIEAAEALAHGFEDRADLLSSIPGGKADPDEELQAAAFIRRAVRS